MRLTAWAGGYAAGWSLLFAAVLTTMGCGGTVIEDRTVLVDVAIPQPCAGPRPAVVRPLKEQFPPEEWKARDVRQKAAAVGKQGLDRQTFGEQLDAATAACPEVKE